MAGLAVLTLGAALIETKASAQTVDVTIIDVGQGDSILIEFPADDNGDRKRMLIDGGPSSATDNAVVQTLLTMGVTHIDIMMLTHPHSDHYLGLTGLLNATNADGTHTFSVDDFWWNGEERGAARNEPPKATWNDFVNARARVGASHVVEQDEEHKYRKARIVFLNSGGEYDDTSAGRDINNDSIVMMLYYKRVKMLFTGDIEEAEGTDLAEDYCNLSRGSCRKLNCKLMKIPHHGSGHFSTHLVKFSDPERILISAGDANRSHHHPREEALSAYRANVGRETFYSTSVNGSSNLKVTIGPGRAEFAVTGGVTGFSYWIDMDELESCANEVHEGMCLEFWP